MTKRGGGTENRMAQEGAPRSLNLHILLRVGWSTKDAATSLELADVTDMDDGQK